MTGFNSKCDLPNFLINRLSDSESLFRYKSPAERQHKTENSFCFCTFENNNEKKKKCNSCESKCRRQQHIAWPALFRERDITSRVKSLQTRRELEHRRNVSNELNKFHLLEENTSDQFNPSGDGSSDSLLTVLAVVSYCKRLLTYSPLARACRPFIGQRNIDQLLRICIRDVRVNFSQVVYCQIFRIRFYFSIVFRVL